MPTLSSSGKLTRIAVGCVSSQLAACHRSWLRVIAFTTNGSMLATAGDDHVIRLWDAQSGMPLRTLGGRGASVEAVAFDAEGQEITALYADNTVRVWHFAPPSCEHQTAELSRRLVRGAHWKSETARNFWSLTDSALPTLAEMPDDFTVIAVSHDSSLLALKQPDKEICVWNRETQQIQCLLQNTSTAWGMPMFSPNNRYLAIESPNDEKVSLFETHTGTVWKELTFANAEFIEATEFAFSADSRLLAVGHLWFAVTLWEVETGKHKRRLRTDGDSISALAFSPDAKVLAVGTGYDETVWLMSLTRGRKTIRLNGHSDNIRSVDFAPKGRYLTSGAEDGSVRLWKAETGTLLMTFQTLPNDEWIIFTPEGEYTGSPNAGGSVFWHIGADIVPAEDFSQTFRTMEKILLPEMA